MEWLPKLWKRRDRTSRYTLQAVQDNFAKFLAILEHNNDVLKIISDMEEKAQGDYLFDINYVRSSLAQVRSGVLEIVEGMIAMGGDDYEPLIDRYHAINDEIARFFPENRPVEEDAYTIPLSDVGSALPYRSRGS